MKVTTYAAKFYIINVLDAAEIGSDAAPGEEHIEIYDRNDDDPAEMIGYFVKLADGDCYQWRNVYGKVDSGKSYNEADLKAALKAGVFYPHQA